LRKLLLIGIMAIFTITTACGVETISEAENEQDTEETSKEQANDNSVVQEETDKGNEAEETSNSNNASDSEKDEKKILFSSGSEAIDYLRKELDMENNENIIFDDMGGLLEIDSYGSYYTIVLYSKEWRADGGSGTLDIYIVYQDGKYVSKYELL
jgi:hypothetical protein